MSKNENRNKIMSMIYTDNLNECMNFFKSRAEISCTEVTPKQYVYMGFIDCEFEC